MFNRFARVSAVALLAFSAQAAVLRQPLVSKPFFNPSLGQSISLAFELADAAAVTARVLDRDGFPVRTLTRAKSLGVGRHHLVWDGRNDAGVVVPNEAWSFRLDVVSNGATETYFPADRAVEMVQIKDVTYDRRGALLRYTLPRDSRVHLQAGVASTNPRTKVVTGPVLKTVVDREPRVAGAVIEHWNGHDESGTIAVPDLPNFVVAVATTPLPENSIITVGSRGEPFIETVASRKGASLFAARDTSHRHHQGLTALQDVTPPLDVIVSKTGRDFVLKCGVTGPAAVPFTKMGGQVMLFVDGLLVRKKAAGPAAFRFSLEADELTPGPHVVAVNWVTPNGPTAANAARVVASSSTAR